MTSVLVPGPDANVPTMRSYILCTTPRSGSTLLCDLLSGSGVAGQPNSFFRKESFGEWAEDFGVDCTGWKAPHLFGSEYLQATVEYGTRNTGCFGLRLMWESLDALSDRLAVLFPGHGSDSGRLAAAFGNPRYIHLVRGDKVAQAISHLKAETSGLWHAHLDGSERERLSTAQPLRYNRDDISRLVASHEADDACWRRWFETLLRWHPQLLSHLRDVRVLIRVVTEIWKLRQPPSAQLIIETSNLDR